MIDALCHLWPHIDGPDPLFSELVVQAWPDGAFNRLIAVGLLRQATNADRVACPTCPDGHIEEIVAKELPDGTVRFFIHCPANLRMQIPEGLLRQWAVDFDRLATLVAMTINAKGQVSAVVQGRLWRLGKVDWHSSKREALLVRGLEGAQGAALAERISRHGRALVFVANRVPIADVWKNRRPAVVPLSQVASFGDNGIQIDLVGMAATVADLDAAGALAEAEALDRRTLKELVRREIKADKKSALTDDALVAAYSQYGSYRKAADALCAEGADTNRYAVERAVQRFGGVKALMNTEDSDSVQRPVASHTRDRSGKILRKAKPTKEE